MAYDKMSYNLSIRCWVPPDIEAALDEVTAQRGLNLSQYVRIALAAQLKQDGYAIDSNLMPFTGPPQRFNRDQAASLRAQGLTIRQIAKRLKVGPTAIHKALYQHPKDSTSIPSG